MDMMLVLTKHFEVDKEQIMEEVVGDKFTPYVIDLHVSYAIIWALIDKMRASI